MYSKIIEINARGLLGQSLDLCWHLNEKVNIISGDNGSGKSTLLRSVVYKLRTGELDELSSMLVESIEVTTSGNKLKILTNFEDNPSTQFDCKGIDFQRKELFFDILDRLFQHSGKHAERSGDDGEIVFILGRVRLGFSSLSSGERKVLQILYNVMIEANADVLVLDEPEISLQLDWQKVLLDNILLLSPSLQILVATHSPAIVMNGWVGCVNEISSLLHQRV